jgi:hypothetical protein
MPNHSIEDCIHAYTSAESIEELKCMNIAFLRGEMQATAYHLGPLNAESSSLVDKLVQLNELDFITTNSQPGGQFNNNVQRNYVYGILPRKYISLFLKRMYTYCSSAFILILEKEFTSEELKLLKADDLYWVTKNNKRNITHISEITFPCDDFHSCIDVYSELVDLYVGVYIMDIRWGYDGTDIIDNAIKVLKEITSVS